MNDKDYLDLEYELYQRKKQRTRMERYRVRAYWWRFAASLLGLFILVILLCAHTVAQAVIEEEPITTPVEEPNPLSAPSVEQQAVVVLEVPEEPEERFSFVIENATITHYCVCKRCCGKDEDHPYYGITASGREAEPYLSVAVDPALIPLGSWLYLDFGDGERILCRADDTGRLITGAKIDLCVQSHSEALELGVRTAAVYVLEGGKDIDQV